MKKITDLSKSLIQDNPAMKKRLLQLLFKRKPYQTQLRGIFWLFFIAFKYFRRGISLKARLDLVPFHAFRLGKYAKLERNVVVNNGMGDVVIEDEVQVGIGSIVLGPVHMGKYSGISQYVRLIGMHHGMDPVAPHHHLPCVKSPIVLGEDVFIGTGTVVMGKKNGDTLTLGDYCRIGANSVVMDDIPAYSIAVGNPARVVRTWDFTTKKWVKISDTPTEESIPSEWLSEILK